MIVNNSKTPAALRKMKNTKHTRGILFSFGLVTDIQYADIEDRLNYNETTWRRYRNSLLCLQEAVTCWKSQDVAFVAQLGDIIDGFNTEKNKSREALQSVLREFQKLPSHVSLVNVLGNHELYNFTTAELTSLSLHGNAVSINQLPEQINSWPSASSHTEKDTERRVGMPGDGINFDNLVGPSSFQADEPVFYFTFSPHQRFRVVVLDAYDVSILGRKESSVQYKETLCNLAERNKNTDLGDPSGLEGFDRRFVSMNGGVGKRQLVWLEAILAAADNESQKVIIFSHVPFHPQSCDAFSLLWNYQEVLDVIWKFDCVVSCFYGHDHGASHVVDSHGIHYCLVKALVETPLDSNSFVTVHVKEDGLFIEGHGRLESQILKF